MSNQMDIFKKGAQSSQDVTNLGKNANQKGSLLVNDIIQEEDENQSSESGSL